MITKYALRFTRTRSSADEPWLQAHPEDSSRLTEEEYNNIAVPYWNMIRSQNNFTSIEVTNPDDLTKITDIVFETYQSAGDAMVKIRKNDMQDATAVAMAALAESKSTASKTSSFLLAEVFVSDPEPTP